jgi:hypothetical protein
MPYQPTEWILTLESRRLLSDASAVGSPNSLLADMNGDGKADLIAMTRLAAAPDVVVTIALGQGDGSFARSDHVIIRANTGFALGVGDLDGDGAVDVAVAGDNPLSAAPINGTFVVTALGDGAGKFKRPTITDPIDAPLLVTTFVPEIRRARAVTVIDVDGNGFGDVSVLGAARGNTAANAEIPSIVVHWDPTLPTFAPVPPTVINFNSLTIVNQLHTGDLDGDGRVDLVATNRAPMPPSPLAVVRYDLVTVRFPLDHSAVVHKGGNLLNLPPSSAPTQNLPVVETFGLGDLDGDTSLDLIGRRGNTLRYTSYTAGNSLFGSVHTILAANAPAATLGQFRVGDITGDGLDDVLARARGDNVLATNITRSGGAVAVRWSRVGAVGLLTAEQGVFEPRALLI